MEPINLCSRLRGNESNIWILEEDQQYMHPDMEYYKRKISAIQGIIAEEAFPAYPCFRASDCFQFHMVCDCNKHANIFIPDSHSHAHTLYCVTFAHVQSYALERGPRVLTNKNAIKRSMAELFAADVGFVTTLRTIIGYVHLAS